MRIISNLMHFGHHITIFTMLLKGYLDGRAECILNVVPSSFNSSGDF